MTFESNPAKNGLKFKYNMFSSAFKFNNLGFSDQKALDNFFCFAVQKNSNRFKKHEMSTLSEDF